LGNSIQSATLGCETAQPRLTGEVNPLREVIVIVTAPIPPFLRLSDLEEEVIEKSPGAGVVTVMLTLALWVIDALVPVTWSVYVLAVVDDPTFTVNVDVVEPPDGGVIDVGESVQVEDEGHPETVRATEELKPFSEVTVTV
jgi:hypothetical protein